jgi:colanic acid/amylovoran biosynthesis glycosyltransferase
VWKFPSISTPFINNQLTGLLDRGHEVDILTYWGHGDKISHGDVDAYHLRDRLHSGIEMPERHAKRLLTASRYLMARRRCPTGPAISALNVRRFGREALSLRKLYHVLPLLDTPNRYDVVHAQFGQLGLRALAAQELGLLGGPLVTHFRGAGELNLHRQSIEAGGDGYHDVFQRSGRLLVGSSDLRSRLLGIGAPAGKIEVQYSGINVSRFAATPKTPPHDGPVKILCAGRLVSMKGLQHGITAVAKLLSQDRKLELTIAGDGPYRNELELLVERLGVSRHVRFTGAYTSAEAATLFRECHIALTLSYESQGRIEGIPGVLKEAMACRTPVVATRHGGTPELVEDGVNGYLVPERDPAAVAHSLTQLLDHPETWGPLGDSGRQKVVSMFDIERLNDRLIGIYDEVAAEHPQPS